MKILVVGGTGTIGQAVVANLSQQHQVMTAGKNSGDYRVDMANEQSIANLMESVGQFDSLIVVAGDVAFAPLTEMSSEQWQVGLNSKLMGQIHLARHAIKQLNDGGSITLTSGVLTDNPIPWGTSAAAINGAIEQFAKSASIELPRGIRINVVSPTLLEESVGVYGEFFQGFIPVPASKVAYAYRKSALGGQTGRVYAVN